MVNRGLRRLICTSLICLVGTGLITPTMAHAQEVLNTQTGEVITVEVVKGSKPLQPMDKSNLVIKNPSVLKMLEQYKIFEDVPNLQSLSKSKNVTLYGLTNLDSKQICLADVHMKNSYKEWVTYHELGHAIDYEYRQSLKEDIEYDKLFEGLLDEEETKVAEGVANSVIYKPGKFISDLEQFNQIFKDERSDLSGYAIEYYFWEDPNEYFAECYSLYIRKPDKLKKYGPKTYEFIDRIAHEDEN